MYGETSKKISGVNVEPENISDKDNVVLRATAAREISFFWVNERRSGDLGIWNEI